MIASNGVYSFTNLRFIAQPDYNTSFIYSSTALDVQRISRVSNGTALTCKTQRNSEPFRPWSPGPLPSMHHWRGHLKQDVRRLPQRSIFIQLEFLRLPALLLERKVPRTQPDRGLAWLLAVEANKWPRLLVPQFRKLQVWIRLLILNRGGEDSACAEGYTGRMCNLCNQELIEGVYWARSGETKCTQC